MNPVDFDPFAGGEILRVSPTTGPQREIITSAQMSDEANTAFNEGVSLQIEGQIDVDLLKKCFHHLVDRHDVLRATFSRRGDEICQIDGNNFNWSLEDLSALAEDEQQQELASLEKNIAISPMNLEEGPLFFVWLFRLSPECHRLVIALHHLICDGWSFGIMLNELASLYNTSADDSKLQSADSFFDFAEENDARQISNVDNDYWIDAFKQRSPVTLDLPLDYVRPPSRTFSASRTDYQLDSELAAKLPKAAAGLKASLVNMVMAAYFALLHRLTSNQDIIVGLPVAGQAVFGRLNQMGHMVQLLPIRIEIDPETPFAELVNRVKSQVLNASEHANFTFGTLLQNLEVDRTRVPLISTIFNIDQAMPALNFGDAIVSIRSVPRAAENFEIFLNVVPAQDSLHIEATYSSALFREETIVAWLESLKTILERVVEAPETSLCDLPLAVSVPAVSTHANQTMFELPHADLVSAFRDNVESSPESIALVCNSQEMTYVQLDQRSDQLAMILVERGVSVDSVVGICCQRSADMLVSLLAVLKLGAAYLPLDPEFPPERLTYMLDDSAAIAVIEDEAAPVGVRNYDTVHIDLSSLAASGDQTVTLTELTPDRERVAYLIYTSGSTGKPKGVRVPVRAMINLLEGLAPTIGLDAGDRLLAVTTLSFDIAVLELFMTLTTGATTVIAAKDDVKDGDRLADLIELCGITVMQATPATWRLLLASRWGDLAATNPNKVKALCGGESLPPDLMRELLPRVAELWNMYGPTETTVWSSCCRILDPTEVVTVGKPIANTQIYVLGKKLEPLPVNTPGELCIGGFGVALGYHNRPELTAERFVDHPEFGRIYRTGDMAKVLPDGDIHHLGRFDDQVKLRGFRIELGEIEAVISACPEVKSAAVYLWEPGPEDVRIVACCVAAGSGNLETVKVRRQLREDLPQYMVPQYILSVDVLPLTPNGKVDRKALPRPELAESTLLSQATLVNDTERAIAQIWTDLIHPRNPIGRNDNFFEIGGHSLLALEAIRKIERQFGKRFKPTEIITRRLYTLAEQVEAASESGPCEASGPETLTRNQPRRLSGDQLRLVRSQLNNPGLICDNIPVAWKLRGELDLSVFRKSLQRVVDKHTALRTVISEVNGELCQGLLRAEDLELPEYLDLSDREDAFDTAFEHASEVAHTAFQPLDSVLCRALLYRLSGDEYLFCFVSHLLVFDGWSIDIFLTELDQVYSAFAAGKAPSSIPIPFEYRDFVEWQKTNSVNEENLEYHRNGLAESGLVKKLDFSAENGELVSLVTRLDGPTLEKIEAFCTQNSLRLHEVFFAAYAKALCDIEDDGEISIGIPVTGRYTPDVIGLIGSFISVLPCRIQLNSSSVLSLIVGVAEQLKEFHQHQDISFAQVVGGTRWEHEDFPSCLVTSFSFQDIRNRPRNLDSLELLQVDIPRKQTKLPIDFWIRVEADGCLVVLEHDTNQVGDSLAKKLSNLVVKFIGALDNESAQAETAVTEQSKRSVWRRLFQ